MKITVKVNDVLAFPSTITANNGQETKERSIPSTLPLTISHCLLEFNQKKIIICNSVLLHCASLFNHYTNQIPYN